MGRPQKYDPEVKAAVMAAVLQGQSINSVAREYNIPPATVSSWNSRGIANEAIQKKHNRIAGLLESYLETNLETLQVQAEFFKTKKWLEKQSASENAVLHGVMADKAIRLLEAFSDDDTDTDEETED